MNTMGGFWKPYQETVDFLSQAGRFLIMLKRIEAEKALIEAVENAIFEAAAFCKQVKSEKEKEE